VLGGVPTGKVRYDKLTSAVSRMIGFSRGRVENQRWPAFRSHYGLEPFCCQLGLGGAHEKGGVEQEVGRFRRNHLVPVPVVDSAHKRSSVIRLTEEDRAAITAVIDPRARGAAPVGGDVPISRRRSRSHATACRGSRLADGPRRRVTAGPGVR
jgi:hypothetical protein